MRLPTWFVKLAKPVYVGVQRVPVIGPLVRRLAHWVLSTEKLSPFGLSGRNTRRLDTLEQQLKQQALVMQGLDSANRTLYRHMLELESTLQHTANDALKSAEQVRSRVEFVRDEVMFELRKSLKMPPPSKPGEFECGITQKLISPGVLEQTPLKLNLGCGHLPRKGYVNVDSRELPGVDLVTDVTSMPVVPGTVDEIFAAHLIEHFPQRYLQDVLLPYWRSLLGADGVLRLVLPDAQAMLNAYAEGDMSFDDLALVTFGKQDYDGDFHFVMFSPESIMELLRAAGFEAVELVASNRVNGLCREMELKATRGGAA